MKEKQTIFNYSDQNDPVEYNCMRKHGFKLILTETFVLYATILLNSCTFRLVSLFGDKGRQYRPDQKPHHNENKHMY